MKLIKNMRNGTKILWINLESYQFPKTTVIKYLEDVDN
jgi:hypothetical protein